MSLNKVMHCIATYMGDQFCASILINSYNFFVRETHSQKSSTVSKPCLLFGHITTESLYFTRIEDASSHKDARVFLP